MFKLLSKETLKSTELQGEFNFELYLKSEQRPHRFIPLDFARK